MVVLVGVGLEDLLEALEIHLRKVLLKEVMAELVLLLAPTMVVGVVVAHLR